MIYLSGAIRPELAGLREDVGYMLTPAMGNRPDLGATWFAVDTGLYDPQGARPFDWPRYATFLASLRRYRHRCLFATAPDVVGDWAATWARSRDVLPRIRALGFRAALVAQDGLTALPNDAEYDCLFVGGRNGFKFAESTYRLVADAKARGLWTHCGRVNSRARLEAMRVGGYDSADGTYVKFGPDQNLPRVLGWLDQLQRQPALPLVLGPAAASPAAHAVPVPRRAAPVGVPAAASPAAAAAPSLPRTEAQSC